MEPQLLKVPTTHSCFLTTLTVEPHLLKGPLLLLADLCYHTHCGTTTSQRPTPFAFRCDRTHCGTTTSQRPTPFAFRCDHTHCGPSQRPECHISHHSTGHTDVSPTPAARQSISQLINRSINHQWLWNDWSVSPPRRSVPVTAGRTVTQMVGVTDDNGVRARA